MSISHNELCETMRRALAGGQYGAVRNGISYTEERVRTGRMTAEDGIELLRSARFDWTRVPYDNIIVRHPHPRYWALRQELTRATLRIAQARRWDASANRAPPVWAQCTLGDPETLPHSKPPCHAFTYAKMRRGPGWTLHDALREFRHANSNRYHGDGGTCAILAEEIAEITSGQNRVLATSLQGVHALVTAARDHHVKKSRHSGMWMPSFQQYCQWWEQLFDVALYKIGNALRASSQHEH